jgi:hypothetical protein
MGLSGGNIEDDKEKGAGDECWIRPIKEFY